jgi:2-oxo-4-hydroxy-4-carboxy-5-ureidoimidazoline decarboxylase
MLYTLDELNGLDADAFAEAFAPLFEGAPRFVARLADARPFGSEEELVDAARAVARSMPFDEQVELLNGHPRIGADPAAVSSLSYAEQGYGAPDLDEQEWVGSELEALNEAYEERFGFRYVVFVAGRPRSEILSLLERAVAADPDEELRRGVDDTIFIAADRMRTLRGPARLAEEHRESIALEVSRHMVGEIGDEGLRRATQRLIDEGVESPALLAVHRAVAEGRGLGEPIESLMADIGLGGWNAEQAGQLLALHAAASVLGEVSLPIDGARRIVSVTDHPHLRELIARWESSPDQREAIDVLITREAKDLFDQGAA